MCKNSTMSLKNAELSRKKTPLRCEAVEKQIQMKSKFRERDEEEGKTPYECIWKRTL